MARFVVLYRAPQEVAARFATATPEQAQAGFQLWQQWFARLGPALLDPGRPLGNAMTVTRAGTASAPTEVIGMSILEAGTMQEAIELLGDHQHLHWDDACSITVLQEQPIPEVEAGLVSGG